MVNNLVDKILENQENLQSFINKRGNIFKTYYDMSILYPVAIVDEICEVNEAANFKWWKLNKNLDRIHVGEEIADIFIISLDFCIRALGRDTMKDYFYKLFSRTTNKEYQSTVYCNLNEQEFKTSVFKNTNKIVHAVSKFPTQPTGDTLLKSLFEGLFDSWFSLVCETGYTSLIVGIIEDKQAENVQRQLGNVSGREDYSIDNRG